MSVKAFYFEDQAIRSVLQLPDRIYVIPNGDTVNETKANCDMLKDRLRSAGFNYKVEENNNLSDMNRNNGKFSISVRTGSSINVARVVYNVLGLHSNDLIPQSIH